MDCRILLKFGMLVHCWYPKASQSLKSTHLEIQDGGQPPNCQSLNGYNSGVQGQRVKGQGHSLPNSQHKFTSNISRSLLIYRVSALSIRAQRACALRIVGGSAPHGGCQAHFAKRPKKIFSNQTNPQNPERLARSRSGLRDAMLSQLHAF